MRYNATSVLVFFSTVAFAVYNTIFTESGLFGRVPVWQILSMKIPVLMLGCAHT